MVFAARTLDAVEWPFLAEWADTIVYHLLYGG